MEAFLEIEQRLTGTSPTVDSSSEGLQLAKAMSFVRAPLKSVLETSSAIEELRKSNGD